MSIHVHIDIIVCPFVYIMGRIHVSNVNTCTCHVYLYHIVWNVSIVFIIIIITCTCILTEEWLAHYVYVCVTTGSLQL